LKITITDTVTRLAIQSLIHGVVAAELTAHSQRVQRVHGGQIAKLLGLECPLVVIRGQTCRLILLQSRRSTEEQVETVDVLSLQKLPHYLLVNHPMNVVLACPSVESNPQIWQRMDVTLMASLHPKVVFGVLGL